MTVDAILPFPDAPTPAAALPVDSTGRTFYIDSSNGSDLNNGRAAQMGILALMVHEKLNNDPYIINSLLGFPVPFNLH